MSRSQGDNPPSKHTSANMHTITGLKPVVDDENENIEPYDPNVPYDPYDHVHIERGIKLVNIPFHNPTNQFIHLTFISISNISSYIEALIHMLNSVCGVGFISAPYTFSHFGNLPSVIAACLLSVVVLTSQRLLVK